MSREEFIIEIKKLGIEVNDDILKKLDVYKEFLKEYNSHTNLTRILNDEDIYLKHFYDSLTICKVIDLNTQKTLIDVGSGAGFPGMVIKIFFPRLEVTLLDSNNKKTNFLNELKNLLNIDVEVVNERVEKFSLTNLNKFDIVTSRAVANLRVLSEICLPIVKVGGYFIPLKGDIDEELENAKNTIIYMDGKINDIHKFELYKDNGKRTILIVEKEKETSINKIRSYDKIIKKPLVK